MRKLFTTLRLDHSNIGSTTLQPTNRNKLHKRLEHSNPIVYTGRKVYPDYVIREWEELRDGRLE